MSAKPIVLVIERTPSEGETLVRVLDSPKYHTVFVESADDALAHLESPIDLVLSGISVDDPQGRELMQRWRIRRPHVPFVVMTEVSGAGSGRRALELGATGILSLPLNGHEVASQIAKWLENARQRENMQEKNGSSAAVSQQPTSGGAAELSRSAIRIPPGTTLEDLERVAVEQALEQHHGNRTHAAKELGISVRTLQRKLKAWNGMRNNRELAGEARTPSARTEPNGPAWNGNPAAPRQPAASPNSTPANYRPRLAKV